MAENITNDKLLDPGQIGSSSTTPALQAIKVTILITINLTALTGNAIVCLSVYKKPSLRSKTGYLILALAVTDLTGALFVTPLTTASLLLAQNGTAHWITNDVEGPLCFFQGLLSYGLTSVSLTIMALAAITRYLCVVRPHLYRKYVSVKLIGISVMLIWIVSLGLQLAVVVPGYATFRFLPSFSTCMMSFGGGRFIPLGKVIEKVFLVLWIGTPLSVIVMCYTAIYHTVRRHNSRIANTLQEPKPLGVNLELRKDREQSSDNAAKLEQAGSTNDSWDVLFHTSMQSGIQNDLRHEGNEMKEEEEMGNSHFRSGRRNGIEIQKRPKVHENRRVHLNDCSDDDFECQELEQTSQKGREIITVDQECGTQHREHTRPNHQKGREIITVDQEYGTQPREHTRPNHQKGREIITLDQEYGTQPREHTRPNHQKRREIITVDQEYGPQRREHTRPNHQKGREIITVDQEYGTQRREHTRPNHQKGREISPECRLDKNTAARLRQNRAEAKVTRTVLAVFLGFLVCWIPILMAAAIGQSLPNPTPHWDLVVIYFGALSTAINPFIYAATIRDFRRTYISLFKCNKM